MTMLLTPPLVQCPTQHTVLTARRRTREELDYLGIDIYVLNYHETSVHSTHLRHTILTRLSGCYVLDYRH